MTLDTARALELAGQGRQLADVRAAARPEDPVVEALIMLAAVVEELVRMLERAAA